MIRIKSLGHIVHDAAFIAHVQGKLYLIPAGYEAERPVFQTPDAVEGKDGVKRSKPIAIALPNAPSESSEEKDQDRQTEKKDELLFTISVTEGNISSGDGAAATPVYTITRSDEPSTKTYSNEKSTTAWRLAIEESENDFPHRVVESLGPRDGKGHMLVNGLRLCGLAYAEVAAELAELPGAAEALAAFPGTSSSSTTVLPSSSWQGSQQKGVRKGSLSPPASQAKRGRATSPSTTSQPLKRKGKEEGPTAEAEETTTEPPPPPKKKKRTRKAPPAELLATSTAAKTVAVTPCPSCGLVGAKFCAETGQPHAPPPCPLCGLTSRYCPNTGKLHEGVEERPNRERGEVHLPKKPSAAAASQKKKSAAANKASGDGNGDVSEVTVITTQDGENVAIGAAGKKPQAKRARKNSTTTTVMVGEDGVESVVVMPSADGTATTTTTAKKARAKRSSSSKTAKASAGQTTLDAALVPVNGSASSPSGTGGSVGGELTLAQLALTVDSGVNGSSSSAAPAVPEEPPRPKEYEYPPLRPPLAAAAQHKVATALSKAWWEHVEEGTLPPHVASLHLSFVPHRLPRQGAGAVKGKKAVKEEGGEDEAAVKKNDEDEGGDDSPEKKCTHGEEGGEEEDECENEEEAGGGKSTGMTRKKKAGKAASASASPTTATAPTTIMIHPLEVRDVATSAAGKRLTKFLLQYTSERTKFDVLRNAETAKKASTTAAQGKVTKVTAAAAGATTTETATADGADAGAEVIVSSQKPEEEQPQEVEEREEEGKEMGSGAAE